MIHWDFAVNFFVALFALIDPIGNVPLFAAATAGASGRDRGFIAAYIAAWATERGLTHSGLAPAEVSER